MNNINFALNTDKRYIMPTAMVIVSILDNLNKEFCATFFVLIDGISKKPKIMDSIEKKFNCKIFIINTRKYSYLFQKQNSHNFKLSYISKTTYYRLLIFKLLDVDKVIYLDSDMIVDTDLSSVYKSFPKEKLLGAVVEIQATKYKKTLLSHLYKISDFRKFCLDSESAPYFNAGFFIANLKLAREKHCFEDMIDFLTRYPAPNYADQDTLNAVFGQKHNDLMLYLDPSFDVFCNIDYSSFDEKIFYTPEQIKAAFFSPKIVHYAGSEKPWVSTQVKYFYSKWWYYADKYQFLGFKQKKRRFLVYKFLNLIPVYIKKIK